MSARDTNAGDSRDHRRPIDLTGGKSVYCFNEGQLKRAFELGEGDTESGRKIRAALETLERDLSRNERAALAFILIDRLTKSASA